MTTNIFFVVKRNIIPPPTPVISNGDIWSRDFLASDQTSIWWNSGGLHQTGGGNSTWDFWQVDDGYVLLDGGDGLDNSWIKVDTVTSTTALLGDGGRSVLTVPMIFSALGPFTNTGTGLTTDIQCVQVTMIRDPSLSYSNQRAMHVRIGTNGIFVMAQDQSFPHVYTGSIPTATTWNWSFWTFDWKYSTNEVDIWVDGVKLVTGAETRNYSDSNSFQKLNLQAYSRITPDAVLVYMDYVKIGSGFA